jgi:D-aspartate ligase
MRLPIDKHINAQKPAADWPPVVVAGAYQTGVVLMRDLERRGLKVCGFDCNSDQFGFISRYGTTYLCPNPDEDPKGWVRFMVELSGKLGSRPVLMSSADQFVSAIADHAAELEKHFLFPVSAMSVQGLLATKKKQYAMAAEHGLPVPRTQFITSEEEIAAFSKAAMFPCLLKPDHFREWQRFAPSHPLFGQKLALANTPAELLEQYRLASEVTPEVVVQEIVEGPDTAKLVYCYCYARDGSRLGGCVVRQIRTIPMSFGSAGLVEPVDDPEADAVSDKFMRSIGYVGIGELELKRDTRDGVVRLIEANPRYSVTTDAAAYMGVELGWLHYLDLIGQPVTPVKPRLRNFRHVVLMRDIACLREYRAAGLLPWSTLLKSYSPPIAFYDFDLLDWRVTLRVVIRCAKVLLYPYYRFFFPKKKQV